MVLREGARWCGVRERVSEVLSATTLSVTTSQTFSIQLHNQYNNPLQIGGSRFLIRLTGNTPSDTPSDIHPLTLPH